MKDKFFIYLLMFGIFALIDFFVLKFLVFS